MAKRGRQYNARLTKGGALIPEVRALLRSWQPTGNTDELVNRHIRANTLGKASRARVRDVVRRVFLPRYVEGNPPNAWRYLQPLERAGWPIENLRPLLYYHAARSDALLYDFVTQVVFDRWRLGALNITTRDALQFILEAEKLGRIDPPWSEAVVTRVGQGLLSALRDFGLLEGKAVKRIAPPNLPIPSFVYIAFLIKQETPSGQRVLEHRDWRLFLLDSISVEHLFIQAHQQEFLQYHALGNMVRIDFVATDMQELVDGVLTRQT